MVFWRSGLECLLAGNSYLHVISNQVSVTSFPLLFLSNKTGWRKSYLKAHWHPFSTLHLTWGGCPWNSVNFPSPGLGPCGDHSLWCAPQWPISWDWVPLFFLHPIFLCLTLLSRSRVWPIHSWQSAFLGAEVSWGIRCLPWFKMAANLDSRWQLTWILYCCALHPWLESHCNCSEVLLPEPSWRVVWYFHGPGLPTSAWN